MNLSKNLFLSFSLISFSLRAGDFYVITQEDALIVNQDNRLSGTLREAINYANANPGTTIHIPPEIKTIKLNDHLPIIAQGFSIKGPLVIDGQHKYKAFAISPGVKELNFEGVSVINAQATGGAGGNGGSSSDVYGGGGGGGAMGAGACVFVPQNSGSVSLITVGCSSCNAKGGQGGDGSASPSADHPNSGGGGGGGYNSKGGDGGSANCCLLGCFDAAGGGGGGGGGYYVCSTSTPCDGGSPPGGGDGGDGSASGGGGGPAGCNQAGNNAPGCATSCVGQYYCYAGGGSDGCYGTGGGGGGNGGIGGGDGGTGNGTGGGGGGGSATSQTGGNGGDGGTEGGGGGGGGGVGAVSDSASGGNGGNGGGIYSGGGGGAGSGGDNISYTGLGGNGAAYGGGGGGGGWSYGAVGGNGGYGAGGGGSGIDCTTSFGYGGTLGGHGGAGGGSAGGAGGGGAGLGGAIFVGSSSSLSLTNLSLSGNSVTGGSHGGGSGGTSGSAVGSDIFLSQDASITVNNDIHSDLTIQEIGGDGNGGNSVTFTGGATVTLNCPSGGNTYFGSTYVSGGATVSITNDKALGVNPAGNSAGDVYLGDSTTAGTLSVSGTSSTTRDFYLYPLGQIEVASGDTYTINGVIQDAPSETGTLYVQGGGTFVLGGTNTYSGGTAIKPLTTLKVSEDDNLGASTGKIIFDGNSSGVGGTLVLTQPFPSSRDIEIFGNLTTAVIQVPNEITGIPTLATTLSGNITENMTGTSNLSLEGIGTNLGYIVLGGNNSYTGTTNLGGVTLSISSAENLGGGGDVVLAGTSTLSSSILFNGTSYTLPNTFKINSTNSTSDSYFDVSTSGVLTISGSLVENTPLVKTGTGTLELTNSTNSTSMTSDFYLNAGTLQINNGGAFGGTLIANGSGTVLEFNGNVTDADFTLQLDDSLTLQVDPGTISSFNGTISSDASASNVLTINGGGTVSFGGDNSDLTSPLTVSGTPTTSVPIQMTTLIVTTDSNLGAASTLNLENGAVLELNSSSFASSKTLEISGGATLAAASPGTGSPVQVTTWSGDIEGTGGITFTGISGNLGALTLGGDSTYTGGTTLDGISLSVGSSSNLGSNTVTFDDTGTVSSTLIASSSITLNNDFDFETSGTFAVPTSSSTLEIKGDLTVGSGITVSKTGLGTLYLSGTSSGSSPFGTFSLGGGTLEVSDNSALGGFATFNVEGVSTLELSGDVTGATFDTELYADLTLQANSGTSSSLNGTISSYSGSDTLTIEGGGTVALGGDNSGLTSPITVTGSGTTVIATAGHNLGGATSINFNDGTVLELNSSSFTTTQTLNTCDMSTSYCQLTIEAAAAGTSSQATWNGTIEGGANITYTGIGGNLGALALGGSNTYGGTSTLTGIDLSISQATSLSSGEVYFDDTGSPTSTLTATGTGLTISNDITFTTTGGTLSSEITSPGVFEIDGTLTAASDITVNKSGPGILYLENSSNSLEGTFDLDQGTLQIGNAGSLGGTLVFNGTGTTFEFIDDVTDATFDLLLKYPATLKVDTVSSLSGTISSNGNSANVLTVNGGGTLALNGINSSLTSPLTITGSGTNVEVAADDNLGVASSVNLSSRATLSLTDSSFTTSKGLGLSGVVTLASANTSGGLTPTWNGTISGGTVSFTYTGLNGQLGALILGGNNTYSGTSILDGITLSISSANNLGSASVRFDDSSSNLSTLVTTGGGYQIPNAFTFVTSGGTLDVENSGVVELDGVLTAASGISVAKTGPGTLYLANSSNSLKGTFTLNQGTLQISNSGALGGTLVFGGAGTIFELKKSIPSSTLNLQVNQSGTIQADSSTSSQLNGTISGAASLTLDGGGTLVFGGNNTSLTGPLTVLGPSTTLEISNLNQLGSGALILKNGGILDITSSISSFSDPITLDKLGEIVTDGGITVNFTAPIGEDVDGSSLDLIGSGTRILSATNTFTGQANVLEGTLVVNGSLDPASTTTVSAGATLTGLGSLGTLDVYGTLDPTDPPIPFTAGPTTLENGSLFTFYANGTNSNQILVNGPLTIVKGSTLQVAFISPTKSLYPVILATDPRTGTFSTVTNPFPRMNFTVLYGPTDVLVEILGKVPFVNFLPSGNLRNIAQCFEEVALSKSQDNVLIIFDTLSKKGMAPAFNQLDSSFFNAIPLSQEATAVRVRDTVVQHVANKGRCTPLSLWVTPFYETLQQASCGKIPRKVGYRDRFGGFTAGVDYLLREGLLLTSAGSYSRSQVHIKHTDAKATADNYTGALAGFWNRYGVTFDAYGAYHFNKVHARRNIFIKPSKMLHKFDSFIQPIDRELRHKNSSNGFTAHLGASYDILASSSFIPKWITPRIFGWTDYILIHEKGYKEKGGGTLNLQVKSKNSDLLRPQIGVGCALGYCRNGIEFFGDAAASYAREIRFKGRKTKGSFEDNACVFEIKGILPNQSLFVPRLMLGASFAKSWTVSASYSGAYGGQYTESEGTFELSYTF